MKNKLRILYFDADAGWVEDDYEEEIELAQESDLVTPSIYANELNSPNRK